MIAVTQRHQALVRIYADEGMIYKLHIRVSIRYVGVDETNSTSAKKRSI